PRAWGPQGVRPHQQLWWGDIPRGGPLWTGVLLKLQAISGATVLVETSSNGAIGPSSPRGVGGSCLVNRFVMRIDAYLDRLASADPTPGGGGAAPLVGAMGAALCAMVGRITLQSARHAAVHPAAEAIVAEADALRARFEAAREIDEQAYALVVQAGTLPKRTDEEKHARPAAMQAALIGAAEAPLEAAG